MPPKLSPLPHPFALPIEAARRYSLAALGRDLVAGLTVSVVAVPQSMAYALIAGVPAVYGLYTVIIQGLLTALLSSSTHLSAGPINTQSLLVASAVARLAPEFGGAQYLQLVFAMTLLKGLMQIGFSAAKLGNVVRYVSRSVIVGFTAGAGVLIAAGQLPALLGIASRTTRDLPALPGIIQRMWPYIRDVDLRTLGTGAGALAIVLVARRISRFVPGPLIATVAAAALVAATGWENHDVAQVGPIAGGLPKWTVPALGWKNAEALFGGAVALALVGMMEAYSIAATIAARTGERINPNQELLAQGASNVISAFFSCIPGSGSFSRSALNYQAGAQTCFAGVYNSLFVLAILLVFAPWARFIPLASLAAILLVIAYGLVDWRYIMRVLPGSREDAVVCMATFLATVLIPLEFALVVGVFFNIGLYLRRASRLHMAEIIQAPGGLMAEVGIRDRRGDQPVMLLQVDGDLFFGVADEFQQRLADIARTPVRVVIFRLKGTYSIDATILHVLETFTREMHRRSKHVLICGLTGGLRKSMTPYGLLDLIGMANVFDASFGIFSSTRKALARARLLIDTSLDTDSLRLSDETDEVTYEI